MGAKAIVKKVVLPADRRPRRIPVGIARGVRMQIDFSHQTRHYLGLYEVELDRHLRRMLRPGVSAFDVGAQHGYDSLAFARRTRGPVAAFECDERCLSLMDQSFALNPDIAPLIRPVRAMVGIGEDRLGLDEWAFSEGFVPDFVKLDIEGGELDALRSGQRLLRERRPGLVVEVHSLDLERAVGRLLVDHGYRPVVVSQRTFLPDRRPMAHNRWLVAGGR